MRGKNKAPMDEIGAEPRMNLDANCKKNNIISWNTQHRSHCYRPCRSRIFYRNKKARL